MSKQRGFFCVLTAAVCVLALGVGRAGAAPFTVSYTDGGSWNTVFAQGFSPSLSPSPNPGLAGGDPVYLNQFQFYKSGNADSASNIQLAIISGLFSNLQGLTTGSPAVVGLSTNTVAETGSIATGSPISFSFASLPLTYGGEYGAVFVNVGAGGALTLVQVSALTANYVDVGGGDFHPATNYGAENQFQFATSNFITTNEFGSFFNTFSYAGDANFSAALDTVVPEPAAGLGIAGIAVLTSLRRRRRAA